VQFVENCERKMTRDQIAEAKRLAEAWTPSPRHAIERRPQFDPMYLIRLFTPESYQQR
jgi:hypothetical protein